MHNADNQPRLAYSPRFCLSERGQASEAAYRHTVSPIGERIFRDVDAGANAAWADACGLHPGDGRYLVELAHRPLTLRQLGEALAVHSQTVEMIGATVERLVLTGFLNIDRLDPRTRSQRTQ